MPLNYNPQDASNCLPKGEYEAILSSVKDSISKKGNPMQVINWSVLLMTGEQRKLEEFVVVPTGVWRLKKLSKAFGREADFNAGTFQLEQHIDSRVILMLDTQEQEGFPEKNVAVDYKPAPTRSFQIPAAPTVPFKPTPMAAAPLTENGKAATEELPF